jgi:hypothetical protein
MAICKEGAGEMFPPLPITDVPFLQYQQTTHTISGGNSGKGSEANCTLYGVRCTTMHSRRSAYGVSSHSPHGGRRRLRLRLLGKHTPVSPMRGGIPYEFSFLVVNQYARRVVMVVRSAVCAQADRQACQNKLISRARHQGSD